MSCKRIVSRIANPNYPWHEDYSFQNANFKGHFNFSEEDQTQMDAANGFKAQNSYGSIFSKAYDRGFDRTSTNSGVMCPLKRKLQLMQNINLLNRNLCGLVPFVLVMMEITIDNQLKIIISRKSIVQVSIQFSYKFDNWIMSQLKSSVEKNEHESFAIEIHLGSSTKESIE